MCWVAWDKLIAPKALGGLGIRDIQAYNKALLTKQAWRIIPKPECLFSRVLRGKYCSKAPFLQVDTPKAASHGWRGILVGRDLLLTNLSKAIGDGESTRVWKDPWLNMDEPLRPVGPMQEVHQDLCVADLLCRETLELNIPKKLSILPQHLPEILRIKPSVTGATDSFMLLASRSGMYSAKSSYYVATAVQIDAPTYYHQIYKAI